MLPSICGTGYIGSHVAFEHLISHVETKIENIHYHGAPGLLQAANLTLQDNAACIVQSRKDNLLQ